VAPPGKNVQAYVGGHWASAVQEVVNWHPAVEIQMEKPPSWAMPHAPPAGDAHSPQAHGAQPTPHGGQGFGEKEQSPSPLAIPP
jgi:hypothetical protein